jgi:hypothetical protein
MTAKRLVALLAAVALLALAPGSSAHRIPQVRGDNDRTTATVATFVNTYELIRRIKASNIGGECGKSILWRCRGSFTMLVWLYKGGDGNPRVGSHSWQIEAYYGERFAAVGTVRRCRVVMRWYHFQYAQLYSKRCD